MKKIYIQENKLGLLKEEENCPDIVVYNCEVLEYYDKDAISFVVNEIKGNIIVTVAEGYGLTHIDVRNDMASKLMGFKNYSHFEEYVEENNEYYDKLYSELKKHISDICKTIIYEGRYWLDNGIITFWDNTPPRNILFKILNEINALCNISINDTIVVIRSYFIPFSEYDFNENIYNYKFNGESGKTDDELRAIHLMNQQDKREALTDFRQNRSEIQGKKLGKMPMAQYHSLIYQEEKEVFNWGEYYNNIKRIDESIKNMIKKI